MLTPLFFTAFILAGCAIDLLHLRDPRRRYRPHLNLAYEVFSGPEELDNLRYAVGVEAKAHKRLTLAADVIGRWIRYGEPKSDYIADVAVGARVNVWRTLLVNANVQVPINRNAGLRPDFIWTIGIQYGFSGV